ncbi:alpha/beta fold hydrolase [Neptuniibacter halophilus]|uniref:alpha/beta fold hydrolase n=1 Tax=Neptuniibacter halophilus TaxID=651666 RepID=UPI0025722B7F|nr:alpha/beta fold hydrolase [Neptuniibacter halophilus]
MSLYHERRENPGKPELVLLHGWGMNSQVWGDFADCLASAFSLTLIDLPGLGRSYDFPQPYTCEAVLSLLAEVAPEQASWLGWSMGGQLALAFAERYPQRVEKLVTIASNPCFVQRPDWSCAMPEATHAEFEAGLEANLSKTLNRFVMLQTQGAEAGRETLKFLKQLLRETEPSAPIESLGLLRDDLRPLLGRLKHPILQVFGDQDLLVPVAAAEACEALSGQPVIVYPGAGHLPFYSHREQLCADLTGFLREPLAP